MIVCEPEPKPPAVSGSLRQRPTSGRPDLKIAHPRHKDPADCLPVTARRARRLNGRSAD